MAVRCDDVDGLRTHKHMHRHTQALALAARWESSPAAKCEDGGKGA